VRGGDLSEVDGWKGKLNLQMREEEVAKRRKLWKAPKTPRGSGYWKLYVDHVNQASEGAALDFLVGKSGSDVPRDNH
jgi:dihydroxy-acid dehydratase